MPVEKPRKGGQQMEHRQPSAAEVARTLLTGVGTATLKSAATRGAVPVLHAETAAGAFILVGDGHTLAALGLDSPVNDLLYRENAEPRDTAAEPGGHSVVRYPVSLTVSSMAPVADLNIERGSAALDGTLTPLPANAVPAALQAMCSGIPLAEVLGYRPDVRLFSFAPENAVVSNGTGRHDVALTDLQKCTPDLLAGCEGPLLSAVEHETAPYLLGYVRSLDSVIDSESLGFGSLSTVESVRVIGIDQYGLDLRCTWDATNCIWRALQPDGGTSGGCPGRKIGHDDGAAACHSASATIRISFAQTARTPEAALQEIRALAGAEAVVI
ncbi:hypothetical protein [Arthrobacter sp. H14]|uniref:hypothetical protein n=1 Tax=Arthrobacter sp. H14 TaxID=1312959 RepID=UPI00047D925F|nr:hypothetical protein [Arthrobacter sp. H14]